ATPYNPYGVIEGTQTPFALGSLLDDGGAGDASYVLGGGWNNARVPRLREMASQLSVVGTFALDRGDHYRARIEEPSGDPTGGARGLLTRVVAGLTAARGSALLVPAFHIAPIARFGGGDGALARHEPVPLASYAALPSAATSDPIADALTGAGF